MKHMKAAVLAFCVIFLAALTVSSSVYAQELISSDGVYSVNLPEGYQNYRGALDPEGDEQEFLLIAGSQETEGMPVYILSNSEPKAGTSLTSFEGFMEALTEGVTASELLTEQEVVLPIEDFAVAMEIPSKKYVFTANYGEYPVVFYIYGLEGAKYYYQFCAWTVEGHPDAEAALDEMVRSFDIKRNPTPSPGESAAE